VRINIVKLNCHNKNTPDKCNLNKQKELVRDMNRFRKKTTGNLGKTFLILSIICLVFVTACSPAKPAPEPVPTPPEPQLPVNEPENDLAGYFPLEEGNNWVYEGIGNEFASYSQKVTYKENKKAQVVVSSGTVTANRYEITEDSILHTFRQNEFYENKNILDSPANIQAIILKLPLQVGNSWISESNSCEIIDIAASVETPAVTFKDCLAVKTTYPDSDNYSIYYYAKGIGMVKSEYVMPETTIISQLSSYSIKPSEI
jgi:hypothetical protein